MLTGTGALLYIATGSVPFCFRLTEMYKKGGENFFSRYLPPVPEKLWLEVGINPKGCPPLIFINSSFLEVCPPLTFHQPKFFRGVSSGFLRGGNFPPLKNAKFVQFKWQKTLAHSSYHNSINPRGCPPLATTFLGQVVASSRHRR